MFGKLSASPARVEALVLWGEGLPGGEGGAGEVEVENDDLSAPRCIVPAFCFIQFLLLFVLLRHARRTISKTLANHSFSTHSGATDVRRNQIDSMLMVSGRYIVMQSVDGERMSGRDANRLVKYGWIS